MSQIVLFDQPERQIFASNSGASFDSAAVSGLLFTDDSIAGEIYYSTVAGVWIYVTGSNELSGSYTLIEYFSSPDGVNWTRRFFQPVRTTAEPIAGWRFFQANGYLWVLVSHEGTQGQFHYSSDGVNWTEQLSSTGFRDIDVIQETNLTLPSFVSVAENTDSDYALVSLKNNLGGDYLVQISATSPAKNRILSASAYGQIVYNNSTGLFYRWDANQGTFTVADNGSGSLIIASPGSVAMPGDKSNLRDTKAAVGNNMVAVLPATSAGDYNSSIVYVSNSNMTAWTSYALPQTGRAQIIFFNGNFYIFIDNDLYRTNDFISYSLVRSTTSNLFSVGIGVGQTNLTGGFAELVVGATDIIRTVSGSPRVVGRRLAFTPYFNISSFAEYTVEYKLDSLGGDWNLLYSGRTNVFSHYLSKGFIENAQISYRVRASFNTNPISVQEAVVTVGTEDVARYDPASGNNYIVDELIWDDINNNFKLKLSTPTGAGNVVYRATDIATGKILGAGVASSKGIAEGIISGPHSPLNTTFPVKSHSTADTQIRVSYISSYTEGGVPINVVSTIDAGSKGIKIEFRYLPAVLKSISGVPITPTKGTLYFYPDSTDLPVDAVWDPGTEEADENGTQITTPFPPEPGTGVGIGEGPNAVEGEIVRGDEDTDIIIEDSQGNILAEGKLPPGTPPNPLVTIRRENDFITVIYDGEVIVTYVIDPATFPNLTNSRGWLRFYDPATNFDIATPAGSTIEFLPEGGTLYKLYASDEERPLGYGHPLYYQYGSREQGYTVLLDNSNNVSVILEPTTDQLKAASVVFRGGSEYEITPEVAQAIANAGYGRWVTVIR